MTTLILPAFSLWLRELRRFARQPGRIVGTLATPLLFWLFLGSGLATSFAPGGTPVDYRTYFFPGTLVLVLLFTSILSTISIIEDRRDGFLQSVLVSPSLRASIVLGKVAGATTLALLEMLLLLIPAALTGTPVHWPCTLLTVCVLAFTLTSVGFFFAWRSESVQGFHGIMNLILFPSWMLSGALFPTEGASGWLQILMKFNPVAHGLTALRQALLGQIGRPFLITCCFGTAAIGFALWSVRDRS